jgi:hypothetical protein
MNWIKMDDAIAKVMKSKGCSRRNAMRILAKEMKAGKLNYRTGPVDTGLRPVDGATAVRMARDDPESLIVTLDELLRRGTWSWEEMRGELAAGRLAAFALNDSVVVGMELQLRGDEGVPLHLTDFATTVADILAWMDNAETPKELILKAVQTPQ